MTTAALPAPSIFSSLQAVLAFPFQQPRWQEKLLLGFGLTLLSFIVPLLPSIVLLGYCAEIARRAIADGVLHLPEWKQWDKLLLDGLKLFGVGLVYTLPLLAIIVLAVGVMFGGAIVGGLLADTQNTSDYGWVPLVGMLAAMALGSFAFLIAIVTGFFLPPSVMHVAATGDFRSAFRYREWWPILRANLMGFVWAYLLVMGVSAVASIVFQILYITLIFCILLPFAIMALTVYSSLIYHAAFALAYREGKAKLAAPAPSATSASSESPPAPASSDAPLTPNPMP